MKDGERTLEDVKDLILPESLHKKLSAPKVDFANQQAFLDSFYKTKNYTPFYKAMSAGWGGIGYLLFSK